MKQVLLYGFGSQEAAACALIRQQEGQPRVVQPTELDEKIGWLCGLSGYGKQKKKSSDQTAPGALMLFYGYTQEELDRQLLVLREAKLPVQSLKAVVTPTNQDWTVRKLGAEIWEEHQVMDVLIRVQKLRRELPMPKPTDFQLVAALMRADLLLSGTQEVSLEEAKAAEAMLLAAISGSR